MFFENEMGEAKDLQLSFYNEADQKKALEVVDKTIVEGRELHLSTEPIVW